MFDAPAVPRADAPPLVGSRIEYQTRTALCNRLIGESVVFGCGTIVRPTFDRTPQYVRRQFSCSGGDARYTPGARLSAGPLPGGVASSIARW